MDIQHLRRILSVRDHGSFAKAAEALHMAQPALSKSIAKIEQELGVTIFTRTSTGSALTPMGEMIAARAERVMAAAHDLARDAALAAGGDAGVVRLGVGTTLKTALAPRLLLRIVQAHPRLRLQVEFGAANRLLPLLQSRELDLVLTVASNPGSLSYVEALRTAVIFVVAPDHPLASERRISIARLAEFPCAGPGMPGFTVSNFLGRPPAADTLDAYTANDLEGLVPLALAGHAALMCPAFVVQQELRAGTLAPLDLDWTGTVAFGCFTTHAASYSPILTRITRYAVELAEEIQRGGSHLPE